MAYYDGELLIHNCGKSLNDFVGINVPLSEVAIKIGETIKNTPKADVVEIETLHSWLYSIAINNVDCDIQMTLSEACEDIISRLDGLRNFARERNEE